MNIDPNTATGYVLAIVGTTAAAYERFRSGRITARAQSHHDIIQAKDELFNTVKLSSERWKEMYAEKEKELLSYREKYHKTVQETQAKILSQAEKIATLEERTDMSPVIDTLSQVMESIKSIIAALAPITGALDRITQRLDRLDKQHEHA